MRRRGQRWRRQGGGAGFTPYSLGMQFSYRPERANVTLDGSGNVELIINEVNPVATEDLVQSVPADRPAWAATSSMGRPAMTGDGVSQMLDSGATSPAWATQCESGSYTWFVVAESKFHAAASMIAGATSTTGTRFARMRFGPTGGGLGQVLGNQRTAGGNEADGDVGNDQSFWGMVVEDFADAVTGQKAASTFGALSAGRAPVITAPLGRGVLLGRRDVNPAQQWSPFPLAWFFGYNRALSVAEQNAVTGFLTVWGSL